MASADEDRRVATDIERMLYAPDADAQATCQATLAKAVELSKSLTTAEFVSGVRSYIDDFKSRCKTDLVTPTPPPVSNNLLYGIAAVVVVLLVLGVIKLKG